MKGKIFSIEEFATFDGPGIRTTVFLKGCPLKCVWCHNPEGQNFNSEYVRNFNGCLYCGKCEQAAKKESGIQLYTSESVKVCPRNLIRLCGEDYFPEQLVQKLLKNEKILKASKGGITFSGGEPLSQSEFILECIKLIDKRLNVAVQTSGFVDSKMFDNVLLHIDYCLYDLKIFDNEKHKIYCGVDNTVIKQNYEKLVKSGIPFITRIPLIPEVVDNDENLKDLAEFMNKLGVKKVEVLPYNKMAGAKYPQLLREYKPNFNELADNGNSKEIFAKYDIKYKVM